MDWVELTLLLPLTSYKRPGIQTWSEMTFAGAPSQVSTSSGHGSPWGNAFTHWVWDSQAGFYFPSNSSLFLTNLCSLFTFLLPELAKYPLKPHFHLSSPLPACFHWGGPCSKSLGPVFWQCFFCKSWVSRISVQSQMFIYHCNPFVPYFSNQYLLGSFINYPVILD